MLPIQCKLARVALGWGVRDLARETGMSPATITRFERGERLRERTVAEMREVLERQGVEFLPASHGKGPGLRINPCPAVSQQ